MHRLLTVLLLCCTVSAPAWAQKKKPYEKFVPRSQREAPEQGKSGDGDGELRIPSREALNRTEMPGFARCTLNCARPMQSCNAACKGNKACMSGCRGTYLSCANRCGGPIGTSRKGSGGGGGKEDRGAGCTNVCVQVLSECKTNCGGKASCVGNCYEQMSSCSAACE